MNIIEKQTELGKSLYEINTSTMKEYLSMQRANIEKYVEVNREFGTRLPEVKDISSAVELQREYSEMVWNQAKESMTAQTELLKGAFNETREALKSAYSTSEIEEAAVAVEKAVKTTSEKVTETVKDQAKTTPAKAKTATKKKAA
jgi:hypothetical protein